MGRRFIGLVWLVVALTACSDAAPTTTTAIPSTTESSGGSTSSPTTTLATTTTAQATTTALPTTTLATTTTEAVPVCPDLPTANDPDAEYRDITLAAWDESTGEQLWEIPLGSRLPHWGVWSDEIVLGFPDGQLVGIGATTCDSWSIIIDGGIDDVGVTEGGTTVVVSSAELAGFSGRGADEFSYQASDTAWRIVAENAGVIVFVDSLGDLLGLDSGGNAVFTWGGTNGLGAAAVSGTLLFRSTGAEVAARPVAGGSLLWTTLLADVNELFAVPGTLLAVGGGQLHALEPQTGELRWTIPFDESISGPAVLDHGELHLASLGAALSHNLWHFNAIDGSTVFAGTAPADTEWFAEMDDALLTQVGTDGTVRGIDMLENEVWSLPTGANRIDRFTQVEIARGSVVLTLTFSAERF